VGLGLSGTFLRSRLQIIRGAVDGLYVLSVFVRGEVAESIVLKGVVFRWIPFVPGRGYAINLDSSMARYRVVGGAYTGMVVCG